MRRKLLAVVGGNYYFETPVIFEFRQTPVIWFNRDEDGYLLLNINMLTSSNEPRVQISDNYWMPHGEPNDLECPPSGRLLDVRYDNGDRVRIEFLELNSIVDINRRYPESFPEQWGIDLPITDVEVQNDIGGTYLRFGPQETTLPGQNIIRNCLIRGGRVGIALT
jgi:hypothetical protein